MRIEEIVKLSGLQFMPVRENKRPIFDEWQITKKEYDFNGHNHIGLVCGRISGNIEAIDIDTKYDLTGTLFKDFCEVVKSIDASLLKKLIVQRTKSGGYHLIYRCSAIDGNKKIANRYTTKEERDETFRTTYQSGVVKIKNENPELSDDEVLKVAKEKASKASEHDKERVLFETRGEKGFIVCYPTEGYKLLQGSFDNVPVITPEERATLFNVAYGFNEVLKEHVHKPMRTRKQVSGLTPIEDYNQRGDVLQLLLDYGWQIVGKKGSKILMKRPGDTKADHSGNYDEDKSWFSVFTTSTEFQPQTPYQPYAVYTMLKCGGDYALTPKRLAEEGFGDAPEKLKENNEELPSIIDTSNDDDLSFIASDADYDDYLHLWRTNTFTMGQTTGIAELDKYFRFKQGNLVPVNGLDNVGKSTVIWYLMLLCSMHNDWKWLVFSSENHVGSIIRKLVEFYWCEPITNMSELKYKKGKEFVLAHFDFIKSRERMYNYQDIINMTTLALKKKKYNGLMVDPYNSLKIERSGKGKVDTYEYHYTAASTLQLYGKQNNLFIFLNCHAGSSAARNKDKEGFTVAPQKEDTEMGVMFSNKADDFLTLHRVTQHETEWNITEIHVRKIKETETGGKVTPKQKPIKMKSINGIIGFECFGVNAVQEWHLNRQRNNSKTIEFDIPKKEVVPTINFEEIEEPPF